MRTYTTYPDNFPASWASGWGEDQYGLWMTFNYKGIRHLFRWCEPGTFLMGSPADEPEREPWGKGSETQHRVTLTRGFWIAETPVTQALWEIFMGDNPSRFKGAELPVENVSWDDAQRFINKLNGIKPELQLCLPTEAQWEYACRAGTTTPFSFGDNITTDQVNYDGNIPYNDGRKGEYRKQTVEVKSLPPNAWGLYQMHGNVWEWCQDRYETQYPTQPVTDPQGADSGTDRVLRGGSWISLGGYCRSAYRDAGDPADRDYYCGFRLSLGL
jgi:formylglycine-generating enzyme required for sulfatase activity